MSSSANTLLLQSPLGLKLVQLCEYLLAKIRQERAVSEEKLDAMPGLGGGDAQIGELVRTYLLLDRVVTVPGGLQPLDAHSQLLVDAILDSPVDVARSDLKAYPKTYKVLGVLEFAEIIAAGGLTPEDRERTWETVRRLRAWIVTHPGCGSPVHDVAEIKDIPSFIADLSRDTLNEIERAFFAANRPSLTGFILEGPMNLADPTYAEYVPEVFQRLSRHTELDADVLMRECSYGKCLALEKLAETVIPGGR